MTNLWKHMDDAHGLILLQSEEDEIRRAVHEDDAEFLRQSAARDADRLPSIDRFRFDNMPTTTNPDPYKPEENVSSDFGGMA